MIHPQPTSILMLLWDTQVPKAAESRGVAAGESVHHLERNPARAFRILSARQAATTTQLGRGPLTVKRRGSLGVRRRRQDRRPACLERTPARLGR
jgi:hypothetical protein